MPYNCDCYVREVSERVRFNNLTTKRTVKVWGFDTITQYYINFYRISLQTNFGSLNCTTKSTRHGSELL